MKKVSIIFLSFLGLALASTAIAIVWIRLQISDSAKICGRLEDEREVVMREVQELRGQRSWALRPSVLASMVSGRLSMPTQNRTTHVSAKELASRSDLHFSNHSNGMSQVVSMSSYGRHKR